MENTRTYIEILKDVNEEYIKEKDLRLGDTVIIERAGDVIPQIVQSIATLRTGNEKIIEFPSTCPVCDYALEKEETEAVWRCNNPACTAQIVERMIHFVSKDAMDIKSFGDANIRKFYELGLLKNIPQIVRLNYTTGNYSMFAEIVCKDIQQLRYVLHDELQKIKGIERTETFISLEESFSRNVSVV